MVVGGFLTVCTAHQNGFLVLDLALCLDLGRVAVTVDVRLGDDLIGVGRRGQRPRRVLAGLLGALPETAQHHLPAS